MVGYLEGIRDCRCVATLDVEDQVGAETGMQHRGVVIEAAPCFNNRRKNLVVDVNRLGGVESLRLRFGDDDGDGVADVEDPVASQHLAQRLAHRSEEHTSELQSLMRISYAVFCLKKKKKNTKHI